jgi:predicted glycosyltransferase
MRSTGYLKRSKPPTPPAAAIEDLANRVLVTTGGGGDGEALISWILDVYEAQGPSLPKALIVLGPFMRAEARASFEARAASLSMPCEVFEPRMEHLMADCSAVVSMGGYNTFCEILSFDKPALIVPRHTPRFEQTIRAEAAERLGWLRMLPEPAEDTHGDVAVMANALRALPKQAPPSAHPIPNVLAGLENVVAWSKPWLS